MTALGEWLKQLVLIVMLAVFSDLLLPTKSIQKYVRVVLGLAIIAAMLQPILPFFQKDWPQQMADSLTTQITNAPTPQTDVNNLDIQRIKQTMASEEETQANQMIATDVAAQVMNQFHCSVDHVDVSGATQDLTNLRLHVYLSGTGVQINEIEKWLVTQYHIPTSQVVVTAG